jgi:hypothetical protein
MTNLNAAGQPSNPTPVRPTKKASRKKLPRAISAIVLGGLLMVIAFFMLRSGQSHRADYRDFEDCVARHVAPVCVLLNNGSQASSADGFKSNYETQLLLSEIGLAVGGVAVVGGATALLVQRSRR